MGFFEMLQLGAASLFTLKTFSLLIVGLVVGLIAGSIPGLSASNTTAILLPITLGMTMEGSLVFIAAIYVGCQYGGSIPAILLNTPGAVGSVATGLDGYPLAQKGKADYALGISLTASAFGGTLAAILSIFIISPISRVALQIGPAEIFLLALLGIVIIVGVSDESPAMGLLAGLIGILIGAMPADLTLGRPRLTFGFLELYDEFPSLTAMIGLFAFTSLIALTDESSSSYERQKVGQFSQIWEGTKRVFKSPFILGLSTIIGLFIGILPGAGVNIAAFMAYSQAKIWSKNPEEFGNGAPEGVIAPEAANNAVAGGAMVPTMTLGVPGSGTAAVMLAALIMHGVRPGPQVMREYPGQVYAMLLAIVVASAIQWFFAYFYTKFAVKLAATKNQYLIPAVLATCLIGCFATRQFMLDMWLFLIFGIIGYILIESGFPYVSLVLGIVMGALAEGYYMIAINISRGSFAIFFKSVFSWIMWAVILAVLLVPIISPVLKKRKARAPAGSNGA
jgi:putative tricarboxylic transport membrane protein